MPGGQADCRGQRRQYALSASDRIPAGELFVNAYDSRRCLSGFTIEHHHEFIAAPSANDVRAPECRTQPRRELSQQIISDYVTVPIIDSLKAIQIQHQNA